METEFASGYQPVMFMWRYEIILGMQKKQVLRSYLAVRGGLNYQGVKGYAFYYGTIDYALQEGDILR